jgi:hypothetical protein
MKKYSKEEFKNKVFKIIKTGFIRFSNGDFPLVAYINTDKNSIIFKYNEYAKIPKLSKLKKDEDPYYIIYNNDSIEREVYISEKEYFKILQKRYFNKIKEHKESIKNYKKDLEDLIENHFKD